MGKIANYIYILIGAWLNQAPPILQGKRCGALKCPSDNKDLYIKLDILINIIYLTSKHFLITN